MDWKRERLSATVRTLRSIIEPHLENASYVGLLSLHGRLDFFFDPFEKLLVAVTTRRGVTTSQRGCKEDNAAVRRRTDLGLRPRRLHLLLKG